MRAAQQSRNTPESILVFAMLRNTPPADNQTPTRHATSTVKRAGSLDAIRQIACSFQAFCRQIR